MRRFLISVIYAVTALAAIGCVSPDKLSVESCRIVSVSPVGLRTIDATLKVGIGNKGMAFKAEELKAKVYYDGLHMADVSCEPLSIKARRSDTYDIHLSITLAKGVSLLTAMALIRDYDIGKVTVDADARLRKGIFSKKVQTQGFPATKFHK